MTCSLPITLIAAVSLNGVIGSDKNDIPWKISEDFKHFKETTLGHVVIMGRKTFESMGSKPLPGRTNIVVTRSLDLMANNVIIVSSLLDALAYAEITPAEKIFVIGGGEIYRQAIPFADELIISHIPRPFKGSITFPPFDLDAFEVTNIEDKECKPIPFTIIHYIKR